MSTMKMPETRWAWVEIDRGALRRNVRAYKNLLGPRQRLCCVVKADAYGHGAIECARVMHSAGADMFAVATVMEGVRLREGGISASILLLSEPPVEAIPLLLEYRIMPTVYTFEFALAYGEGAVQAGTVGAYHLAIETGMNRIGVHYTEVVEFRRSIEFHRGLECDGVFTHFATADDVDGWDYKLQCKRFDEAVSAMREAGFDCGTVHCDNTPATMLDTTTRYDMVRVGHRLVWPAAVRGGCRAHVARASHERAGAHHAHNASRHGRGRELRLHLPCSAHIGADLHDSAGICRRPFPRAL